MHNSNITFLLVVRGSDGRCFWRAIKRSTISTSWTATGHVLHATHWANTMQQIDYVIPEHHNRQSQSYQKRQYEKTGKNCVYKCESLMKLNTLIEISKHLQWHEVTADYVNPSVNYVREFTYREFRFLFATTTSDNWNLDNNRTKYTSRPVWSAFPCRCFVPRRFLPVIATIHVSTEHNQQLNEQWVISLYSATTSHTHCINLQNVRWFYTKKNDTTHSVLLTENFLFFIASITKL